MMLALALIGWLGVGLPAAATSAASALPSDPRWGLAPVWDDGRAEVATYASRRNVYGVARSFETVMIVVKEDFDRARAVKADPPHAGRDLVTVLKMNLIARIETESYPYHYMTSVFVRRDDPRVLLKLAHSSQDWCGTTFKEIVTWSGPPRLVYHSYFDGQGDGEHPMTIAASPEGHYTEEQLFLALRAADPAPGGSVFRLYASLVTNSVQAPASRLVRASVAGVEPVSTPAGDFTARRIEILPAEGGGEAPLTFWIGTGAGRPVVRFESADGRSMTLTSIGRRDYWSR